MNHSSSLAILEATSKSAELREQILETIGTAGVRPAIRLAGEAAGLSIRSWGAPATNCLGYPVKSHCSKCIMNLHRALELGIETELSAIAVKRTDTERKEDQLQCGDESGRAYFYSAKEDRSLYFHGCILSGTMLSRKDFPREALDLIRSHALEVLSTSPAKLKELAKAKRRKGGAARGGKKGTSGKTSWSQLFKASDS